MDSQEYFQAFENYFWEWDEEYVGFGSLCTLAIPDSHTIAYDRFAIETLHLLAPDGIPPFGSLLLALAATNTSSAESIESIYKIIDSAPVVTGEERYPNALTYARRLLETLSQVPARYKEGERRKYLLQAIFQNCHNRLSSQRATALLEGYDKGIVVKNKKLFSRAAMMKDFSTLGHISVKFPTVESVLKAIGGVPEIKEIEEEIVDQEPAVSQDGFVQELIKEPKTFHVGSLVQRIWSGLNIPLHHSAPSMQPLGGISDLTNKGDFDKLLISEFANEDEVFMSRIANNEALYIKREVPPESEKFLRMLLIDSSLKNWGTPRTLGFASAIAIATHPKTDIECRLFALGNTYTEVNISTIDEVIDGLDILGSKLDAGYALTEVLSRDKEVSGAEVFVITTEDALKEPAMQKAVYENHDKLKYLITTTLQGEIYFYKLQNRSSKLVQHIKLPLEELWKNVPSASHGRQVKRNGPRVQRNEYPILFPLPRKILGVFEVHDNYYIISASRTLYHARRTENLHNSYGNPLGGCQPILTDLSIKGSAIYTLGTDVHADDNFILLSLFKDGLLTWHNLNTSEFIKHNFDIAGEYVDYKLLYTNGDFFITNSKANVTFSISKSAGTLAHSMVRLPRKVHEQFNAGLQRIGNLNYRPGSNLINNLMPVCIDAQHKLRFNKHQLQVKEKAYTKTSFVSLAVEREYQRLVTADYEKTEQGSFFRFSDGSTLTRDARGILTLTSSNTSIPQIFIPLSSEFESAMATNDEFAGNMYFYNDDTNLTTITIKEFYSKYITPFINHIMQQHGVKY